MTILQKPDDLSLLGNLKKLILQLSSTSSVKLESSGRILLESTYDAGPDGKASIDFKEIISKELSFLLKTDNFYEQANIVKTFTCTVDNTSFSFTVMRAGVSELADSAINWLTQNFLTWQPQNKSVTYYSPEFLTMFAIGASTLKLKAYFPDNTTNTITLGTCAAGKAYTANLQYAVVAGLLGQKYPSYFDVWTEDNSGNRLSYIQRYYFSEVKSEQEQWFLFENSLGGIDTIRAYGDTDFQAENEHKISQSGENLSEYKIDTKKFYNKNTGYLDEYERKWLLDFFPSRQKFVHFRGAFRPIVVTESDVKYTASDLPSDYTFKYRFASDTDALLNLVRNESSIPVGVAIPNLEAPDFSLPPRLAEFPRTLNGGAIIPAFDPYTNQPATTTIGAIVDAASQKTLENIPGASGGGTLVQVLDETSPIPATNKNVFSALRTLKEIGAKIADAIDGLKTKYIRKDTPDEAAEFITFIKGLKAGKYNPGLLGSGAALQIINGLSYFEVDHLSVRQRAFFFSVLINEARSVGGTQVYTSANMLCNKVEEFTDYYRCFFDRGENNQVNNLFTDKDRARCQVFSGSGQKFYWRKVVAVGDNYIDLSKTDCAPGVNDIPAAGDTVFQLGSDDPERQAAIIISTVGDDAPSIKQYAGINGYSLVDKETTVFSRKGNRIMGSTVFKSDGTSYEDWINGVEGTANTANNNANKAIADAEAAVADYNTKIGNLQSQIDGEISNWFYPYSPTLSNYPASAWTDAEKARHVGDTFTNTQNAPLVDAGKSWRFVVNNGVYSWTQIADSDAVLALQKAAQAQSTADGKSTTYLIQPTSYKLGDMWVLASDQTVNGVAYKSGEILTATQDSTTYNQAHWVKKVRYTDDTAVNDLQTSGINLLNNSCEFKTSGWNGGWGNNGGGYDIDNDVLFNGKPTLRTIVGAGLLHSWIKLENNVDYTYCAMVRSNEDVDWAINSTPLHYHAGFNNQNQWKISVSKTDVLTIANQWKLIYITFKLTGDADSFRPFVYRGSGTTVYNIAFTGLVRGVKPLLVATSSESDKQAKIEAAKQEALTAASNAQTSANNAQNSANTANQAVSTLNGYVDGAFKDGLIDSSEAKAIEKYINVVNSEKAGLEATYNKLYVNTYLEGTAKTNLLNAKVTYFGAVDTLLNSINTAISDGKTSVAEKQDVDSKYATYKTALASLQSAIEDANKAIQSKIDQLSTDKVNNIKIDTRNLLLKSNVQLFKLEGENKYHLGSYFLNSKKPSGMYTLVANMCNWGGGYIGLILPNSAGFIWDLFTASDSTIVVKINATQEFDHILFYHHLSGIWDSTTVGNSYVRWACLYEGDVKAPLTWIEAPEDVQARISAAQAKADETAAKTQFQTKIDGGLIYTAMMKLVDAISKNETAGLNGIPGDGSNPAFWAGGTYAQALQNTAKAIIRHNGKVKFSDAEIEGVIKALSGVIGNLKIDNNGVLYIEDGSGVERFRIGNILVPLLWTLINSSEITSSATTSTKTWTTEDDHLTFTYDFPEVLTITKTGSDVTITGGGRLSGNIGEPGDVYNSDVRLFLVNTATGAKTFIGGESSRNETIYMSISETLRYIPAGSYKLRAEGEMTTIGSSNAINAWIALYSFSLKAVYKVDLKQSVIGENGLMAFFGKSDYFYAALDANNRMNIGARGIVNVPGVPIEMLQINEYGSLVYSMTATAAKPKGGYFLSTSKTYEGQYRVNITGFSSRNDFLPKVSAHLGGQNPHYAQIIGYDYNYVDVWTADDASCNNGGFLLELFDIRK